MTAIDLLSRDTAGLPPLVERPTRFVASATATGSPSTSRP